MQRKLNKIKYYVSLVIILLPQFVTTTIAVAETMDAAEVSEVTMTDFQLTGDDAENAKAVVTLQYKNTTEEQAAETLTSSLPLKNVASDNGNVTLQSANTLSLTIESNSEGTMSISVERDPASIEESWTMTLPSGQQQTIALPAEESEEETNTEEMADVETEELEDTEATEETKTKEKETSKAKAKPASAKLDSLDRAPGNIKEIFADDPNINNILKSFKLTGKDGQDLLGKEISINDEFIFSLDWEMPESIGQNIVPGDIYEFQLPKEIVSQAKTIGISNGDTEIGEYHISSDGLVQIKFKDGVKEESSFSGKLTLGTKLQNVTKPGELEIAFPYEDNLPKLNITVKSEAEESITKEGKTNKNYNADSIDWTVRINQGYKKLTNVVIKDTLPKGLNMDQSSLVIYPAVFNIEGHFVSVDKSKPLVEGVDYKLSDTNDIVFLKPINSPYEIAIKTDIDESYLGENSQFRNKVDLSSTEENAQASSEVSTYYHKSLQKEMLGSSGTNQEYSWEIKGNYSEKLLETGTVFKDSFTSKNMQLVKDSIDITVIEFDEAGEAVEKGPFTDFKLIDNGNNGFDVELTKETNQALKIKYKTKVEGYVGAEGLELGNSITLGSETVQSDGQAGQQSITKDYPYINYHDKTMSWKITVNNAGYEMTDYRLEDKLSNGLTLKESSVVVQTTTGARLELGKDYELTYEKNLMVIAFLGKYKEKTTDSFVITYQTEYDPHSIDEGVGSEGEIIFNNAARQYWKDNAGVDRVDQTATIPGYIESEFTYNGEKTGVYNAKDKKIDWTVDVNLNQNELKNGIIEDVIKGHHSYVPDSAKLYKLEITENGSRVLQEEVATFDMNVIQNDEDNTVLKVQLPEGQKQAYRFVYQTSLAGFIVDKPLTNTAVFTNNNISHELQSEVEIPFVNSVISKFGKAGLDEDVQWKLYVNPSQSTLRDIKVVDTLSSNSLLSESSIKVYEAKIENRDLVKSSSTPVSSDVYKTTITKDSKGSQTLELFFEGTVDKAYIVEYTSVINSEQLAGYEDIYNSVRVEGENVQSMNHEAGESVNIGFGNGNIQSKNGSLTIEKVDADNQVDMLPGAKFDIWQLDKKGNKQVVKYTGETDEKGKWEIPKFKSGKYLLVETKAPKGYSISEDLKEGRLIVVSFDNINKETITVENKTSKAVVTKVDGSGNPLKGATFELYNEDKKTLVTNDFITENSFTTNEDGQIVFKGLSADTYYLKEIKAPNGFVLDDKWVRLAIMPEDVNGTKNIEIINYQGSAELTKQSDNNTPLEGAEFSVYTETDEEVVSGLVSDEAGKVVATQLAPGKYYFKETKAPNGFIKNAQKVSFEISDNVKGFETDKNGQLKPVNAGTLTNYQGSMALTKVNEAGDALDGAEFALYAGKEVSKEQEALQTGITSKDGNVSVTGLAPGHYYLMETKAPTGFMVNTTPIHFEITSEADGQPEVATLEAFTNYQGSVVLTKQTEDGTALEGAEFAVFEKDTNKEVQTGLVSDAKGQVTAKNLAPGKYYFKETKAPTGYVINKETTSFDIQSEAEGKLVETVKEGFTNYQGSVTLLKQNAKKEALAQATFELVNVQTNEVKEYTTDETGRITVENLAPGEYYFKESSAPTGYMINSQKVPFTIDHEASNKPTLIEVTATNYQGSVTFQKVDASSKEALEGVVFDLYHGEDMIQSGLTTDADGRITVTDLAPGSYEFREAKALDGYILNTKPIRFKINQSGKGEPTVIDKGTYPNYQGRVELEKYSETNTPLADARFSIFTKDGKEVRSNIKSNDKGIVSAKGLAPGDYYFEETKAPKGYERNEETLAFTIMANAEGQPGVVKAGKFYNYKGTTELVKRAEDGTPLSGAEFTIYSKKGQVIQEGLVSNKEGKISVKDLSPGIYYFKETKAPAGYVLNEMKVPFKVNKESKGQPVLIDSGNLVNYKGSVELIKVDASGSGLRGAEFVVLDHLGKVAGTATSNKNGRVVVKDLAPGDYLLKEVKAPKGFILNTATVPFTIVDSAKGKPKMVKDQSIANFKGQAELMKETEDGKPLEGAEFSLFTKSEKLVQEGLVSNKDGKVVVKDLAPGKYYFKETKAPKGYILNEKTMSFSISKEAKGEPETVKVGNLVNYQGTVELMKQSKSKLGLEGAEFAIFDTSDQEVQTGLVSNKEGKVTAKDLAPGKYYFKETKAPSGYVRNEEKVPFEIVTSAFDQPKRVSGNILTNYKGQAELLKVAENKAPLAGAEFSVYTKEDVLVSERITSDKDGKVLVKDLAPGSYYFKETKAPVGYVLNEKTLPFEIVSSFKGEPILVEAGMLVNYQGTAELSKLSESGEGLEGAEFSVFKKDGKEVQTGLVSDKDGKLSVKDLAPGEYYFEETKAPEGYILNNEPISFAIVVSDNEAPALVTGANLINYKGTAELQKVSAKGEGLEGTEFSVFTKDGKEVQTGLMSDKDGKVSVEDLSPGAYYFKETKAPTGFILNEEVVDFIIEDTTTGEPAVVESGKLINYQGTAELQKVSAKGEGLEGAEFSVFTKDGKEVQTGLMSDKDGKVSVENLSPGAYYFKETKAPTEYELSKEKRHIVIVKATKGKPATVKAGDFVNNKESEKVLDDTKEKPKKPTKPTDKVSPDTHGKDNVKNGKKTNNKGLPKTGESSSQRVLTLLGFALISVLIISAVWFKKSKMS